LPEPGNVDGQKEEIAVTNPRVGSPDLAAITRAASREAGGTHPDLLGDYLPTVLAAARTGRRLTAAELAGHNRSGGQAAENGVALRDLVDLYLSATWRLWRELPVDGTATVLRAAGLAVLRAADDAVAAAAEGFEQAHLSVARHQEAERIEFLDDLLGGHGSLPDLVAHGARLGLVLAGRHQVVLAGGPAGVGYRGPEGLAAERLIATAVAPARSLTTLRGGRLVAIIGVVDGDEPGRAAAALAARPAASPSSSAGTGRLAGTPGTSDVAADPGQPSAPAQGSRTNIVAADPRQPMVPAAASEPGEPSGRGEPSGGGRVRRPGQPPEEDHPGPSWRVAVGRAYAGPAGVLRSYGEATDALDVAERLSLSSPVVNAADLLMYRVILRDRAALTDLVTTLLAPLAGARDGAGPLLETLDAYFAGGQVAAEAARRLFLSVRAVTYRLARIKALTGLDPADPADALSLQVAVVGARLLDWPASPLDPT
jgi:PucR C-terminal helix-turn-helix domain/GGDEF-like domain